MKLTLEVESPLLSSSGESSAHIDADIKYDLFGFPYIQGKTLKGLLRESAVEVCEMEGTGYSRVAKLFGVRGSKENGLLFFNDLLLQDYQDMLDEYDGHPGKINASFIKQWFTAFRKQTSIVGGVAEETTLRNYRLLKEGNKFESTVENLGNEEPDLDFFKKAVLNLRYMGVRRNRGFGKVKIIPTEIHTYTHEKGRTTLDLEANAAAFTGTGGEAYKMGIMITTLSSVLFSKVVGDQNTVSTEKYIPAQNIRGLIAGLLLKITKNEKPAHLPGSVFHELILAGKVKYNDAYINGYYPTPKIYGFNKATPEGAAKNMLETPGEALKGLGGYSKISNNELHTTEVSTSFSFHNSRNDNRTAGKSMEGSGAIFYYEGIDKGQQFETFITGPETHLTLLEHLLNFNDGEHRMGRSKTAQYSKVKFKATQIVKMDERGELDEIKSILGKTDGYFYLVFMSPLVTLNEAGMAVPDISRVGKEISQVLDQPVAIDKAISSQEWVENYMGVWRAKTPREAGFSAGTTIRVSFNGTTDEEFLRKLLALERNGLGERRNEGYGRVKIMYLPTELNRARDQRKSMKKGNSIEPGTEPPKEFENEMLKAINADYLAEQKKNRVRLLALQRHPKRLPNSLIARMKTSLLKGDTEWNKFIIDINEKKAWKTLRDAKLWDELKELKSPVECTDFDLKKEYWLTYFKLIRRKNKVENHE